MLPNKTPWFDVEPNDFIEIDPETNSLVTASGLKPLDFDDENFRLVLDKAAYEMDIYIYKVSNRIFISCRRP